jgi:hypothetical protein
MHWRYLPLALSLVALVFAVVTYALDRSSLDTAAASPARAGCIAQWLPAQSLGVDLLPYRPGQDVPMFLYGGWTWYLDDQLLVCT